MKTEKARRNHVYTGVYSTATGLIPVSNTSRKASNKIKHIWKNIKYFLTELFYVLTDNYTVTMFLAVLLLSLFIPLITKAVHDSSEANYLKKMMITMSKEVAHVQTDYEKVADEMCSIHCYMKDVETETGKGQSFSASCECTVDSQAVQGDDKKNFFQRLFHSKRDYSPDTEDQNSRTENKSDKVDMGNMTIDR